jgi:adenylosuccinate lyase
MELTSLTAISPVDGRYMAQTAPLRNYFSEFALIKYRVWVEIEYFIALNALNLKGMSVQLNEKQKVELRNIYTGFTLAQAEQIKQIEKVTNHDVKAVEYYIKQQFDILGLSEIKEFVHFGLTSQDINNTAIPLILKHATEQIYLPLITEVANIIKQQAETWKEIPMLARTHGQPASPTRLGKEWMVFYERLSNQLQLLQKSIYAAKFGGATGNFNAHVVAYPTINWIDFANTFCNNLQLTRMQYTTQIEHYDHLAAWCDNLKRINTILIDFCRDVWQYIAMDYFKQKLKEGEVGSSAMPHKVNPIDFENAEGNLGVANALLAHFAAKLPISRLQRDLTDSTVLRNIGMPMAHMLIALNALKKGLGKLLLNPQKLNDDLEHNWAVVAEAIQTILRREGFENPYETLKALTRTNETITKQTIWAFIDSLDVTNEVKRELKAISPQNYTGIKF